MNTLSRVFILLVISLLVSSCSKMSEKDLYNLANTNIKDGKYLEAMNNYKTLLEEYPRSNYRVAAKFELGKMYQGNVVPDLSKNEGLSKAVEIYSEIYKEYPDSTQAINSLFMVGFLEANELNRYEEAKETYKKFIEAYPDHPLAVSALAELKNLGKSPEEILQEKINDN